MKTLLAISALLLCSCGNNRPKLDKDPDALARLHPATGVAVVLADPLGWVAAGIFLWGLARLVRSSRDSDKKQ